MLLMSGKGISTSGITLSVIAQIISFLGYR
jgi:hypothetical protein